MELRTHPKMEWEGFFNWPPAWVGSYGRGEVFPIGEAGFLVSVEMAEADNILPRHLKLTVEYDGKSSSGLVCCDDEQVTARLFEILKRCIGWEISRIGDLDVDL
jgi:hypothetical protein